MKLGLHPPRAGAIPLRLATYIDFSKLVVPPLIFGHYPMIPQWGMLGNDDWGNCAEAGPSHMDMLWLAEANLPYSFTTASALRTYSAITNFNPNAGPPGENPTDQGTDLGMLADFWLNHGIYDGAGNQHKVAAVVDMNPGDLRELWVATYLFQCVGMGFSLPNSAMKQTQNGQVWDVVQGSTIDGGHFVPCVGRDSNGNGVGVTWGQLQPFTPAFYQAFNNQGLCAFSEEMLVKGASIDGFDDQLLRADIEALAA